MSRRFLGTVLAILAPGLAGCDSESVSPTESVQMAVVADAEHGGKPLSVAMTQENTSQPLPAMTGDEDGVGQATITLNHGQREVCWELSAARIQLPATASHIHRGSPGVRGPAVVTLSPPDANGKAVGCAEDVDRALIRDILQNPGTYYVNVHTVEFPAGAIRGQFGH